MDTLPHATRAAAIRPSFFLCMTVIMTLFILGGFGLTYWMPMASRTLSPLPPVVHLHGAFFFSWMVLLVVQAVLINRRRIDDRAPPSSSGRRCSIRLS